MNFSASLNQLVKFSTKANNKISKQIQIFPVNFIWFLRILSSNNFDTTFFFSSQSQIWEIFTYTHRLEIEEKEFFGCMILCVMENMNLNIKMGGMWGLLILQSLILNEKLIDVLVMRCCGRASK